MSERLTAMTASVVIDLSKKVDYLMSAIDDLKAAEAELTALVSHTVSTVADLSGKLDVVTSSDAEVAAVADRLRKLKETLAAAVGLTPVPVAPEVAPVSYNGVPGAISANVAAMPGFIVDPVTNTLRPA